MGRAKKNFIYNTCYQILALAIPLVTTPYLTRTLGASGIGNFSYAYSIAYYFVMVMQLGLANYGNREIAKVKDNKRERSTTFWGIFAMQSVCSVIAIAAYFIYTFFLAENYVMALTMIPYIISGALDINWFFFGMEEFKITVTRNTVIKIITTIGIFSFVKDKNDAIVYTLIITIGLLLTQLSVWPFLIKRVERVKLKRSQITKHIKPNLILFISVVAVSLYKMMDKIMLGSMMNTTEVGYYDSSEKIIQIPMAVVSSLGIVMLPRMSNLFANSNDKEARSIFGKSIELAMFLSTSIGFGIMAIAKTFVPWFYGEDFMICVQLFNILIPSCMFLAFANVIRTQYLIPHENDIQFIISVISGAAINLIFNIFLIPIYGAVGAAVGTLAAEAGVCIIQIVFVYRELLMKRYLISSLKFIIPGIVMYILLMNIRFDSLPIVLNLVCQVLIGGAIYIGCLVVIIAIKKLINKNNREKLFNGK